MLVGITYLNHRKTGLRWVESLTDRPYGLPVTRWLRASRGWIGWLELFFLAIGATLLLVLHAHRTEPLPILPAAVFGKVQLLYLVFLWWVVVMNFDHAIVDFTPRRLVTEGTVTLNAVLCTALLTIQVPRAHVFDPDVGFVGLRSGPVWVVVAILLFAPS